MNGYFLSKNSDIVLKAQIVITLNSCSFLVCQTSFVGLLCKLIQQRKLLLVEVSWLLANIEPSKIYVFASSFFHRQVNNILSINKFPLEVQLEHWPNSQWNHTNLAMQSQIQPQAVSEKHKICPLCLIHQCKMQDDIIQKENYRNTGKKSKSGFSITHQTVAVWQGYCSRPQELATALENKPGDFAGKEGKAQRCQHQNSVCCKLQHIGLRTILLNHALFTVSFFSSPSYLTLQVLLNDQLKTAC